MAKFANSLVQVPHPLENKMVFRVQTAVSRGGHGHSGFGLTPMQVMKKAVENMAITTGRGRDRKVKKKIITGW